MKKESTFYLITKEDFKAIREKLGLSQWDFAKLLNYSYRETISDKERGARGITLKDMQKLQKYMPLKNKEI